MNPSVPPRRPRRRRTSSPLRAIPPPLAIVPSRVLGHLLVITLCVVVAWAGRSRPLVDRVGALAGPPARPVPSALAGDGDPRSDRLGPVPHLDPPAANPSRLQIMHYEVQPGDTVSGLAERFDISAPTIIWANDLDSRGDLSPGQQLVILPVSGVLYAVRPGDTVDAVARRFQSDGASIAQVNQLTDPARLAAGSQVIVPGGRIEEAPRTALGARSFARPRDEVSATQAPDPRPSLAPTAVVPAPSAQPERPAWVPFPARFSAPRPLTPLTYTVADGDTLTSIAARFGVSPESIALSSGIQDNADSLSINQKLVIPPVPGVVHVVQPGDTLEAVAERYSAPVETIARANELHDPFVLQIGEILVVPGGKVPAASGDAAASGPSAAPTSGGWSIVGVAAKYLGYPYVWGGSSPAGGFDCSGFVYYVYRAAGMPIPRDMWGQLQSGTRVSYGNLQPGDIVFFVDTYQPGLSHDGIYLGGGRFIQAETEGVGVVVTSLSNPYWAARYYGATRPW